MVQEIKKVFIWNSKSQSPKRICFMVNRINAMTLAHYGKELRQNGWWDEGWSLEAFTFGLLLFRLRKLCSFDAFDSQRNSINQTICILIIFRLCVLSSAITEVTAVRKLIIYDKFWLWFMKLPNLKSSMKLLCRNRMKTSCNSHGSFLDFWERKGNFERVSLVWGSAVMTSH